MVWTCIAAARTAAFTVIHAAAVINAHAFEDIEVKQNALVLLEEALRRKRKKCYDRHRFDDRSLYSSEPNSAACGMLWSLFINMAAVLQCWLNRTGSWGILICFKKINASAKMRSPKWLWPPTTKNCAKKIEPYVSTTHERFEALKQLRDAGIPTVVLACSHSAFYQRYRS